VIGTVTNVDIPFTIWDDYRFIFLIPVLPVFIGFLAGLYPSFYLTSFLPIKVLKGKLISGMGNSAIRNGLVVVQFVISISLITGTLVVFQQLNFMSNKQLGFDRENILIINDVEKMGDHLEAFRNEVAAYPGVMGAAITMDVPGRGMWEDVFSREGSDAKLPVSQIKIDEHYFELMKFKLAAGRAFEIERPSDTNAIIPNETTVRLFGWTNEEAIGKYIVYPGNDYSKHEIIGVVKDFHFQSLRQSIAPLLFANAHSNMWGDMRALVVKFKSDDLSSLISRINSKWKSRLQETPMEYTFLDQEWAKQYQEENKLGGMFGIFSGLSILIAVIGLFGLVSYSAEVKRKEIGIRKVFGASTSRLMMMMNSQYIKLIIVALVLAIPLSWWLIEQWLKTFEFKMQFSPLTFVVAGLTEIVIAVLSVGYLSWRAATLNPANVLKDE
jgi:putative ABC transport system permease protein